jgi:CelD/BcsL family acetyltransferase involved in cellulose biosynthesis
MTIDTLAAAPEATEEIIRDLDALQTIADDWRRLRDERNAHQSPFGPARLIATMRTMSGASGGTLTLVRRQGDRARTMVIGRLDRRRVRCLVGYAKIPTPRLRCLNIPYGGLLVADDPAEREAAAAHVRRLLSERIVDHVMVSKLTLDDPMYPLLAGQPGAVERELRPHWRADLIPGDYEATAERFERKDRYNRRKLRQLEKGLGEIELEVVDRADQLDGFFAAAAPIVQKSYQAQLGAGFEDTPLWRAILTASAEAGELRCYLLRCGREVVAFQVGTASGGTYILDAAAFDPDHRKLSPGACLLVLVIRDLCEAGFERLDYGFGDAAYKQQYGTTRWEERNLHLYGPGAMARLAGLIDRASVAAAVRGKRALGDEKTQRLRRSWRERLEKKAS